MFLLNQLSSLPSPRLQALDEPTDRLLRWAAAHDLSALDVAQLVSWQKRRFAVRLEGQGGQRTLHSTA